MGNRKTGCLALGLYDGLLKGKVYWLGKCSLVHRLPAGKEEVALTNAQGGCWLAEERTPKRLGRGVCLALGSLNKMVLEYSEVASGYHACVCVCM